MKHIYFMIGMMIVLIIACKKDPVEAPAEYDPIPYEVSIGDFPDPEFPADNKPTKAGVQLGRMLFYERLLSKDGSQACADCHHQQIGFSDSLQFSIGVEKLKGTRQAMPIINLAWHRNGMFWDGRAPLVRDQALKPIQDPLEMNETLPNAVAKIAALKKYRDQFIRAFGSEDVTSEKIGLAIEQFEFTMISNNSKFDQYKANQATLTSSEERGRQLFFTEFDPKGVNKGAECFHCHGTFNFTNDEFMNNGLNDVVNQLDLGRQKVTNDPNDRAKFKTPTLRNIAVTAPYMHNGKFKTLEEVVDHYNTGVINSPTIDILMQFNLQPGGLGLSVQDKQDLVAFLKTLTDNDFLNNSAFKKPF